MGLKCGRESRGVGLDLCGAFVAWPCVGLRVQATHLSAAERVCPQSITKIAASPPLFSFGSEFRAPSQLFFGNVLGLNLLAGPGRMQLRKAGKGVGSLLPFLVGFTPHRHFPFLSTSSFLRHHTTRASAAHIRIYSALRGVSSPQFRLSATYHVRQASTSTDRSAPQRRATEDNCHGIFEQTSQRGTTNRLEDINPSCTGRRSASLDRPLIHTAGHPIPA